MDFIHSYDPTLYYYAVLVFVGLLMVIVINNSLSKPETGSWKRACAFLTDVAAYTLVIDFLATHILEILKAHIK